MCSELKRGCCCAAWRRIPCKIIPKWLFSPCSVLRMHQDRLEPISLIDLMEASEANKLHACSNAGMIRHASRCKYNFSKPSRLHSIQVVSSLIDDPTTSPKSVPHTLQSWSIHDIPPLVSSMSFQSIFVQRGDSPLLIVFSFVRVSPRFKDGR